MKKLLLVALLMPMVALPGARRNQASTAKRVMPSEPSSYVVSTASTATAGSGAAVVTAADLANDQARLANLLAAYEAANGLVGGTAAAGQADYQAIFGNAAA